jgi:hypothetical protein
MLGGALSFLCIQVIADRIEPPQIRVDRHLAQAKEYLGKGDRERAIISLAKAVAVDAAPDKAEALRMLRDTASARTESKFLERLLKQPQPEPPVLLPQPDWSAEELIRAYFQAPTWRHRLPFVVPSRKTETLMAEYYQGGYSTPASFRVRSIRGDATRIGGSFVALVDLPTQHDVPYVIARTAEGYRIDWEASLSKWEAAKEAAFRASHGLIDANAEVELLRLRQSSPIHVDADIRVSNQSQVQITYWRIDLEVYDSHNRYLAHVTGSGTNLQAGQSTISELILSDAQAARIASWKIKLSQVNVKAANSSNIDVTTYFSITERKGTSEAG